MQVKIVIILNILISRARIPVMRIAVLISVYFKVGSGEYGLSYWLKLDEAGNHEVGIKKTAEIVAQQVRKILLILSEMLSTYME